MTTEDGKFIITKHDDTTILRHFFDRHFQIDNCCSLCEKQFSASTKVYQICIPPACDFASFRCRTNVDFVGHRACSACVASPKNYIYDGVCKVCFSEHPNMTRERKQRECGQPLLRPIFLSTLTEMNTNCLKMMDEKEMADNIREEAAVAQQNNENRMRIMKHRTQVAEKMLDNPNKDFSNMGGNKHQDKPSLGDDEEGDLIGDKDNGSKQPEGRLGIENEYMEYDEEGEVIGDKDKGSKHSEYDEGDLIGDKDKGLKQPENRLCIANEYFEDDEEGDLIGDKGSKHSEDDEEGDLIRDKDKGSEQPEDRLCIANEYFEDEEEGDLIGDKDKGSKHSEDDEEGDLIGDKGKGSKQSEGRLCITNEYMEDDNEGYLIADKDKGSRHLEDDEEGDIIGDKDKRSKHSEDDEEGDLIGDKGKGSKQPEDRLCIANEYMEDDEEGDLIGDKDKGSKQPGDRLCIANEYMEYDEEGELIGDKDKGSKHSEDDEEGDLIGDKGKGSKRPRLGRVTRRLSHLHMDESPIVNRHVSIVENDDDSSNAGDIDWCDAVDGFSVSDSIDIMCTDDDLFSLLFGTCSSYRVLRSISFTTESKCLQPPSPSKSTVSSRSTTSSTNSKRAQTKKHSEIQLLKTWNAQLNEKNLEIKEENRYLKKKCDDLEEEIQIWKTKFLELQQRTIGELNTL